MRGALPGHPGRFGGIHQLSINPDARAQIIPKVDDCLQDLESRERQVIRVDFLLKMLLWVIMLLNKGIIAIVAAGERLVTNAVIVLMGGEIFPKLKFQF